MCIIEWGAGGETKTSPGTEPRPCPHGSILKFAKLESFQEKNQFKLKSSILKFAKLESFQKKNHFKLKTPQICKARISFSKRINSSRNLRGDKICGPTKRQSLLCSWPSQPLSPHVYLSFVGLCGALLKILNSNTYTWSVCKRCVSLTWNTCKTCKTFRTCQMGRICQTCKLAARIHVGAFGQNTRSDSCPLSAIWGKCGGLKKIS